MVKHTLHITKMIQNFFLHKEGSRQNLLRKSAGFTLLEILLTLSIGGAIILVTTECFLLIFTTRETVRTMLEIEEQSRYMFYTMGRIIRESDSISSPPLHTTDSELIVEHDGDSIIFSFDEGVLWMTQGSGNREQLSGGNTVITELKFSHLSPDPTPIITIEMTVLSGNNTLPTTNGYEQKFQTSISLRR